MNSKKGERKRIFTAGILIVFAVIFSFLFDAVIVKGVSFLRNVVLDKFFFVLTYLSSEIVIFAIITALFLIKDKKRRWVLPLWLTLAASAAAGFLMKVAIQRERPFQLGIVQLWDILREASYGIWNFSFPSNHSMLAFCVVPILAEQYPRLKKVWVGLAVLIAFSRIYFGLHFLSDVIVGGLIGYVIGMLVVKIEKEHKFGDRFYEGIIKNRVAKKVVREIEGKKTEKKINRKKKAQKKRKK